MTSNKVLQKIIAPIRDLVYGNIISLDFFRTYWFPIVGAVMLLMVYITNKYNTRIELEQIHKLKNELSIVRTECVRERAAFMSRVREQRMQQMVDSLHLGLHVQEQPPFALDVE